MGAKWGPNGGQTGERWLKRIEHLQALPLILAEELLSIFNKTDDDDDGGAGHSYKEHDLERVHCK
jgi:hypothetical protein